MLGIRLEPDLEVRLEQLAKQTGQTKSYYAREAIKQYLDSHINSEEAHRQSITASKADRNEDWELGADESGWTA